jgi:hypothetical protein
VVELVERLDNIYDYGYQHLKAVRDRMKDHYNPPVNLIVFHVWLFLATRTIEQSPKVQPSLESPYEVVARINDIFYEIQGYPRAKMMAVQEDRLASCES